MHKIVASIFVALVIAIPVSGQIAAAGDPIRVRAGKPVLEAFPNAVRLRHQDFGWGRVTFQDGTQSELHLFNYDLLLEDILTIGPQGDTVVFDDQSLIKFVEFSNAIYLRAINFRRPNRRQPYFEIVGQGSGLMLGVRNAYLFTNKKQPVSPGQSAYADFCATTTLSRRYMTNVDYIWSKFAMYYIIDGGGNSYHFNKASLQRLYPKYQEQIDNYLKKIPHSFDSGPDIEKLFAYCTALGAR